MHQDERTQNTINRILSIAIKEFAENSYDTSKINTICKNGHIPKGLLYHNFKGKDDLYLHCVKLSLDALLETMNEAIRRIKSVDIEERDSMARLRYILLTREKFFDEHPLYAGIFFHATLQPPMHLETELSDLRKDLDRCFNEAFLLILDNLNLRNGVTREVAVSYFGIASELFNSYYRNHRNRDASYSQLVLHHEEQLTTFLNIIFYGIAKRPENEG